MSEIEPTIENLMDPYVLQLIKALAKRDDEIERLNAELQLAWNTCDDAETKERRLRAALEKYADPDWWPEQLQSHDYLRKLAREVLKDD